MFDQALDIRAFRIGDELSIELDNGDVFDGIVSGRNIHRPEQAQNWVEIHVTSEWEQVKEYADHKRLTLSQLLDDDVITSITLAGRVDAPPNPTSMEYEMLGGVENIRRVNQRDPVSQMTWMGYRLAEKHILQK